MKRFIFLGKDGQKLLVQQPSQNAIQNLLERTRERASYKDFRVIDFVELTKMLLPRRSWKEKWFIVKVVTLLLPIWTFPKNYFQS